MNDAQRRFIKTGTTICGHGTPTDQKCILCELPDEKKPREWWIDGDYANYPYVDDHKTKDDSFHVIEYSTYEKLQSELTRTKEALYLVIEQDRTRGYPTGQEWLSLVSKIRSILDWREQ